MADDSDGEFVVDDLSDEDQMDHNVGHDDYIERGGPAAPRGSRPAAAAARSTRAGGAGGKPKPTKKRRDRKDAAQAWEQSKRTWETNLPDEDGDGTLNLAALEAERRRRLLRDTTPLQRGIIRHLVLVLDMSSAMAEKDLLPTRYRLTLGYAAAFVRDFFEQNPISQLAVVGMRDGVAVRVSDLSGNPGEHIARLRELEETDPQGNPSLQNALEMCRGALFHTPSHGTREVLVIYGALLSSDPGDIHDTIDNLVADRIRVSIVGLSAQVAICAELCSRTNEGHPAGSSSSYYTVAMDEVHYRELFLAATTPPPSRAADRAAASLLMMGFPSRTLAAPGQSSHCACHSRPAREGYDCTRCAARLCRLPAECPACGLTLVLSTHLARSYHHLFPLRNWVEVPWAKASSSRACFACMCPFPEPPAGAAAAAGGSGARDPRLKGVSESGRYACEVCGEHFCIDCDVFAHEIVHNCPGCQSGAGVPAAPAEANGSAMVVDG